MRAPSRRYPPRRGKRRDGSDNAVVELSEVGELGLLARIVRESSTAPDVIVGPGDDCAVLRLGGRNYLWTTDDQIEGTHFETAWMTPRQIGAKAYLVNASDIAAMGGRPKFALVGLAAPPTFSATALIEVQRGLCAAAARDGVVVIGGNVARAPGLQVAVSLLGEAPPRPLLRSGARAGDAIYVSGTLGDAALGLRQLQADRTAAGASVNRFRRPQPRLEAGAVLAREGIASAVIDVSDGLLRDLGHLCRASGVGAWIETDALPTSMAVRRASPHLALEGGEDYELLCAVPTRKEIELERILPKLGCRMTRIGVFRPSKEGILGAGIEHLSQDVEAGYSHFMRSSRARG